MATTLPTISPERSYDTWKTHKSTVITCVHTVVAMDTRKDTSNMLDEYKYLLLVYK